MPRVVPSQVLRFIDQVFPWAKERSQGNAHALNISQAGQAAGLLDLVGKIPDELLIMGDESYSEFVCAVAAIREKLLFWQNLTRVNTDTSVPPITGFRPVSPVVLIRDALAKCPDENPSPGSIELHFVGDEVFRQSLRIDIGAVNRALASGEWKAATVLAGSSIEALLLWAIEGRPEADIKKAAETVPKLPNTRPDEWHLPDYIEAAERLEITTDETAKQLRIAKQFRNLIHPGRARRLAQECNRGTALSAVAGLEHVVRDLERKSVR